MKSNILASLTLSFCLFVLSNAFAGLVPTKEQVEEFKNDKLYVVLQSNAQDLFKYYEENNVDLTEEQTTAIKEGMGPIDDFNAILREVVDSEWDQNKEVEYISTLTFSTMISNGNSEFSYLSLYFDSKELMNSYKEDEKKDLVLPSMTISRHKKKKGLRMSTKMKIGIPSKGELTLAIQEIKVGMGYTLNELSNSEKREASKKNHANELKTRTLLICEDDLSKKLTESDIKAVYPYSFEIVDRETFNKALEEKDETKLNLMIMPLSESTGAVIPGLTVSSLKYYQYIAMPETGEYANIIYKTVTPPGMPTGLQNVRKNHFKSYIKHVTPQ